MIPDDNHINRPFLIYICNKDKEFEERLKNLIETSLHNIKCVKFNNIEDLPLSSPLADLIIYDVNFIERVKEVKGCNYVNELHTKYIDTATPSLIFTTKETYHKTDFTFLYNRPDHVYDFISEDFFVDYIFVNRIRTLLSFPRIARHYSDQKTQVQNNLWSALDYSNLFVLILNKEYKVVLANYRLAKSLGYENEVSLIGQEWKKHLTEFDEELIKHVFEETLKGSKKYEEFTNDIMGINRERITVKWFNTLINSTFNCVFSIGVPLTQEISPNDNIDSVRSYFTDIIKRDRTTINAMKEVTMKYSEKILGKKSETKGETENEC